MSRILALALTLIALPALAQHPGRTFQCGPASVGTSAVAVTFPASGSGPTYPSFFVAIQSPSAGYLCVNPTGAVAAIAGSGCAAGNVYVGALATPFLMSATGTGMRPAAALSVIASAVSTPMTCLYQ